MREPDYWDRVFESFKRTLREKAVTLPSVSEIAEGGGSAYTVLISTIISLRTKDAVTLAASRRLFTLADTPEKMLRLSVSEIERAIYPAGFYKTKAVRIHEISEILLEKYAGEVPAHRNALLSLPGVGVKTANLTLNLGFGIEAICVDTHVHRIANRMGWISTRSPEASEPALENIMPRRYWIPLNELLVAYGQHVCTPVSPFCSQCSFDRECPKIGVKKSR
jgi:endonuclease-3